MPPSLFDLSVIHTRCSVAVCASARVKTYSVWVGRTGQACVVPLPWRWYATHSSLTRAFQPPSFLMNNATLNLFLGGRGRHWISSKQTSKKRYLERWGLLADRYGLPIRDYWKTVQKIFMVTSALSQSFEQCSNSCSFVQSIRGLPTRRNWQTVYIFCERSANNL